MSDHRFIRVLSRYNCRHFLIRGTLFARACINLAETQHSVICRGGSYYLSIFGKFDHALKLVIAYWVQPSSRNGTLLYAGTCSQCNFSFSLCDHQTFASSFSNMEQVSELLALPYSPEVDPFPQKEIFFLLWSYFPLSSCR